MSKKHYTATAAKCMILIRVYLKKESPFIFFRIDKINKNLTAATNFIVFTLEISIHLKSHQTEGLILGLGQREISESGLWILWKNIQLRTLCESHCRKKPVRTFEIKKYARRKANNIAKAAAAALIITNNNSEKHQKVSHRIKSQTVMTSITYIVNYCANKRTKKQIAARLYYCCCCYYYDYLSFSLSVCVSMNVHSTLLKVAIICTARSEYICRMEEEKWEVKRYTKGERERVRFKFYVIILISLKAHIRLTNQPTNQPTDRQQIEWAGRQTNGTNKQTRDLCVFMLLDSCVAFRFRSHPFYSWHNWFFFCSVAVCWVGKLFALWLLPASHSFVFSQLQMKLSNPCEIYNRLSTECMLALALNQKYEEKLWSKMVWPVEKALCSGRIYLFRVLFLSSFLCA